MIARDPPRQAPAAAAVPPAAATPPYTLRCVGCGATYADDGCRLTCDGDHDPALLVTDYAQTELTPDDTQPGLFRYAGWLPARRIIAGAGGTVTYRSEELNDALGLPNLWIAFNGYWPERGAALRTGTFKELEALTVLARLPGRRDDVLVVSSAGNTAAAFAEICSEHRVRCLIVVPENALPTLSLGEAFADEVTVVALRKPADYYDAIVLADAVSRIDGFVGEGGVRNVARRDGLGTVVLDAVETMGRLPDYYFQAVGSAAGGIAAYEAARRLVGDGRFGTMLPRLMLSQNAPFAPIYDAWRSGGDVDHVSDDVARRRVQRLHAHVLSNRRPPYATRGGVREALEATRGDVLVAGNPETAAAQARFAAIEGIDLEPASGVALASLVEAVAAGRLERDATVLLNVTGGGRERLAAGRPRAGVPPALELTVEELARPDTAARVAAVADGGPRART